MENIVSDVLMRVSDKTAVNDSYGRKYTTVCDAVISLSNGMIITIPVRAALVTDKETKEESIVIGPSTQIKAFGATVLKFENEEQENEFSELVMEQAQVWSAYASLQQKAIDRLTAPKAAAKANAGRLVVKVQPKTEPVAE